MAYTRGEWADAERFCRMVLAARGDHFDALSLLGIIAAQTQRPEEAAGLLGRAVAAKPADAAAHSNYGNVLYDLKRYEEALESYARALKIRPDCAEAHYNRGNTLQELKRFDDALESFATAVKIRPDYAEAYYNRGNTLHELRRFEEALESYARALEIRPDFAEAYNNRGLTLQGVKRFGEALESYARALKIRPDFAEAHNNRGLTLQQLRRHEEALESYASALEIRRDYAEAHYNRGNTLQELKDFAEAVESYARALKFRPDYAEAYNNRGAALQQLKRYEEALESYARALQIRPDYAEAHNNQGDALRELERFEEALESYTRALQINPDCDWLFGMWLHAKLRVCDWSNLDWLLADLAGKIQHGGKTAPPFPVLGLLDCASLQRQAADTWVTARYPALRAPPAGKLHRHERIRIGYYSADFHSHATAYLMAELFERHDKRRFELLALSFGPCKGDDMRKRLAAAFDQFLDVRPKSDIDVARMSRELEIDIAVDLKGFTQGARTGIFSCRAAPIQVSYLGYPGTMGAPYIDYLIADQTLIPRENRRQYSEKIVYLPHSYQVNDRKRQIADRVFARAELGLPSTGFVFCCFNQNYKVTPATFAGWMRILRKVPGSVLWLLEDNETAADNLRREAQAWDVSAARLVFAQRMPLAEHLARHRAADLFLDTLPYNAHTTASDALWAGLPVLTRMGESFAARVAASLLNASRLPELVTTAEDQYEATAVALASNPGRLAEFKDRLHRNRLTTPLFDTEQFTRHLENAYTQIYERYQTDRSPEDIYVAR